MREPKTGITNIIGKGTSFDGKLKVEGSVRIDGVVKGNVETTESIIIGKSGSVCGDVRTKDGFISGKVEGNIYASGRLEFQSGSRLSGDISCKRLVIEEGVIFDGSCSMSEKAEPEIAPKPTTKPHASRPSWIGASEDKETSKAVSEEEKKVP